MAHNKFKEEVKHENLGFSMQFKHFDISATKKKCSFTVVKSIFSVTEIFKCTNSVDLISLSDF